jgi:protein O-GlcNAc transferase
MSNAASLIARAHTFLRARDTAGAEGLLREALAIEPRCADALHLLGLLAGRDGRDAECVALLEAAVANGTAEQAAGSGLLLAAAHRRAGRMEAAESALRAVLRIAPDHAEALLRLGLLLQELGRLADAREILRRAVEADPAQALAHGALAVTLHALGELDTAAESAAEAMRLAPASPEFAGNLAVIRNAQGRFAEAAALCRAALASSEDAALWNTLGIALKLDDQLDEAGEAFERALAMAPAFTNARFNLAGVRKDQARCDEAISLSREVLSAAPDLAPARFALCMAHLPPFYRDEAEIEHRRAQYGAELAALTAHADRVGAGSLAAGVGAQQPFYLASQGRNDRELQQRYGTLVCRAMATAWAPTPLAGAPRPGERIRLGIVCGHIRDHSVWRLPTRGWIEAIDRSRFELFAYHTGALRDWETDRAETMFDHFVQGPHQLEQWRARIATDQPHALIYPEIGMDPMVAQLAALRLAAVQYASWGHPTTSGYPTIDHYLSSDTMEPSGAEAHYSERLVRLPGLSTPITVAPHTGPVPPRSSLGLHDGEAVFWSGQSLHKYLPAHDEIFPMIAEQMPNARFVFVEHPGSPSLTARFKDRLATAFLRRGQDANTACRFLPRMASEDYRAAIGCADVVLDSIGWSGCNTLLDALSHALPIVTLQGSTMRASHGAAIFRALGLESFVTHDVSSYVATAAALAKDRSAPALVRAALCRTHGQLEGTDAVTALEQHIASACRTPSPT